MLKLKAKYQEARQSVDEKKVERFRDVIDEYYSFINNYPDTENRSEADNIFKIAQNHVKEWTSYRSLTMLHQIPSYQYIINNGLQEI